MTLCLNRSILTFPLNVFFAANARSRAREMPLFWLKIRQAKWPKPDESKYKPTFQHSITPWLGQWGMH